MEQENKKMKWDTTKIVLAVTAGVAVLALVGLLVWMVMSGMITVNVGKSEQTTPVETGDSYIVTDDAAVAANKNIVATVDDVELTNGHLQIHYWSQVYNFLSNYGSYLSYFGLDISKPFSEQTCTLGDGGTWEEFFLEQALDTWAQMATISIMAEEDGFTLSEEQQEELATIIENFAKSAPSYGYKDMEEMVAKEMGKGATPEDYYTYVKLDYLCTAYVTYLREKNQPTDAQIEEYYAANEATIKSNGFGKDVGKLVDVRHILIKPEGGVLNSDGRTYTYTDAQWEAARQKAQVVYDLWLNGEKTEDSFAELAAKNSADGSAANGGLYGNVLKGQAVEEFDAWIFADGRAYGDHSMVKTVFGYHIIFYVDTEEAWIRYCNANYANEIVSAEMEKFAESYTIKTEYDLIAIAQVDLVG